MTTPKPTAPVSGRRIALAESWGLHNVPAAALACREARLPFFAACALLEKESMGRNVYGHDSGGVFSRDEHPEVTEANFKEFLHEVVDLGETSNGVGPCQLTYRGFFPDMARRGLKAWVPHDNMVYGFGLLANCYKATGTWVGAGTRYNGAQAYGEDLAAKVAEWRRRLDV